MTKSYKIKNPTTDSGRVFTFGGPEGSRLSVHDFDSTLFIVNEKIFTKS
jgi:hypothetical protein